MLVAITSGTVNNITLNPINISINHPADTLLISGFTGNVTSSSISVSSVNGTIDILNSDETGLIAGFTEVISTNSTITNSVVTMDIDSSVANLTESASGFIAQHNDDTSTISNSAYFGNLNFSAGGEQGGFIGNRLVSGTEGICINCFWHHEGGAGLLPSSGSGTQTGITQTNSADRYLQATYTGWDFTNIWQINQGVSYPQLQ